MYLITTNQRQSNVPTTGGTAYKLCIVKYFHVTTITETKITLEFNLRILTKQEATFQFRFTESFIT